MEQIRTKIYRNVGEEKKNDCEDERVKGMNVRFILSAATRVCEIPLMLWLSVTHVRMSCRSAAHAGFFALLLRLLTEHCLVCILELTKEQFLK
jgi:hypothetical protein